MISEYTSSQGVYFRGITGFNNSVSVLNTIVNQYIVEGLTSSVKYPDYVIYDCAIGEKYGSYYQLLKNAGIDIKAQRKEQKGTTTYSNYWSGSATLCNYNYDRDWYKTIQMVEGEKASGRLMDWHNYDGRDTNYEAKIRPVVLLIKSNIVVSGIGSYLEPYKF